MRERGNVDGVGDCANRADLACVAVHDGGVALHLAKHVRPAAIADAAHPGVGLDAADARDQRSKTVAARPQKIDGGLEAWPGLRIGDKQHYWFSVVC